MNRTRLRNALGAALAGGVLLLAALPAWAQAPLPPPTVELIAGPGAPAEGVPAAPPAVPAAPPAAPVAPAAQTPPPAPPAQPPALARPLFETVWNNGLYIQSTDKRFVSHWGATVQYDFSWFSASPVLEQGLRIGEGIGKFNDGANLRRARIFTEGTLWEAVDYKFEIEFSNGIGFSPAGTTNEATAGSVTNSPGPTDAWLNFKDVPLFGNVRIGNQKEWFSLEHLNNYRALEFLERSFLFDLAQPTAFNNGFSPGISAFRTWAQQRVFTAVGAYKNESDLLGFGVGDGQYAVTGRVAALPVWRPDAKAFWHVGGAMSHRDPVEDRVQVRIRDNVRNAPFPLLPLLVNTNLLDAASQTLYNLETAAVWGPLTFQAEYTANVISGARTAGLTGPPGPPQGTIFFQGYYAETMLFLTGESRTWNANYFFFNRVAPLRPFRFRRTDCDGYGLGAWEVAVRYSYLDASNKAIRAGRLDSVTLGLNWYVNTNARLQLNYDYTRVGDKSNSGQGHVSAVGLRTQFDF